VPGIFFRDKAQPTRKANNLTDICEPIVYKMWELRHLTTLWASTACCRDSFVFSYFTTHRIRHIKLSESNKVLTVQDFINKRYGFYLKYKDKLKKLCGLSPRSNNTDRAVSIKILWFFSKGKS
jgi:hypothetical protein